MEAEAYLLYQRSPFFRVAESENHLDITLIGGDRGLGEYLFRDLAGDSILQHCFDPCGSGFHRANGRLLDRLAWFRFYVKYFVITSFMLS